MNSIAINKSGSVNISLTPQFPFFGKCCWLIPGFHFTEKRAQALTCGELTLTLSSLAAPVSRFFFFFYCFLSFFFNLHTRFPRGLQLAFTNMPPPFSASSPAFVLAFDNGLSICHEMVVLNGLSFISVLSLFCLRNFYVTLDIQVYRMGKRIKHS